MDDRSRRAREITVALCVVDPALARRTGDLLDRPGVRLLRPLPDEAVEADVAIADQLAAIPGVPVIALTGEAPPPEAWESGIRAVLPRDGSADELWAVVQAVAAGFAVVPPSLLELVATDEGRCPPASEGLGPDAAALPSLTPREHAVLQLLAEGASNKVIARRLGIAFSTAKFHVASLMEKLGARSRTDALAEGARRGLIML